jgi:hypothetical protein
MEKHNKRFRTLKKCWLVRNRPRAIYKTFFLLRKSVCPWQAFLDLCLAYCIHLENEVLSMLPPGAVFTTLHFLINLRMGPFEARALASGDVYNLVL